MIDRYVTIPGLFACILWIAFDCCRPAKADVLPAVSQCGVERCRCSQMSDRVVGATFPPVEITPCDPANFHDGPDCELGNCRCNQFVEAWIGVVPMRDCPGDR
jgi:hypothetical protein